MSEIKAAQAVWGPPEFPAEGRLELSRQQLEANYKLRKKEENDFKIQYNIKQQINDGMPCCKTLHMSFFFDGTNNHRDSDIKTNNLTNFHKLNKFHLSMHPLSQAIISLAYRLTLKQSLRFTFNKDRYHEDKTRAHHWCVAGIDHITRRLLCRQQRGQ